MDSKRQMNQVLASTGMIVVSTQRKPVGYMETRGEISSFVWDSVRMIMLQHDQHKPIALFFKDNEMLKVDYSVLFTDESNGRGKDLAELSMRAFADELQPLAFSFITEVWLAEIKASSPQEAQRKHDEIMSNGGSLENAPGSRETITVHIETREGQALEMAFVTRHTDGTVKSIERNTDFDQLGCHVGGRFTGILKQFIQKN